MPLIRKIFFGFFGTVAVLLFLAWHAGSSLPKTATSAAPASAAAAPPAPAAVPTVDTFCAGAVDAVKAYTAPGQRDTVDDLVVVGILADRRPHQLGAWLAPSRAGDICAVTYTATLGNDSARFGWYYYPKTRQVEARDDATKRLLGWR